MAVSTATDGRQGSAGIGLLDILFTAALSLGMTPELFSNATHLTGPLSEAWVRKGVWPSPGEFLALCVFFLGLFTTIFSWFGYHRSINERPLKYTSPWSLGRFTIDVILIIMYGLMMIFFRHLDVVLLLLMIIFLLYAVWDGLRFWEYREDYGGEKRFWIRPHYGVISIIPVIWAIVLTGNWALFVMFGMDGQMTPGFPVDENQRAIITTASLNPTPNMIFGVFVGVCGHCWIPGT